MNTLTIAYFTNRVEPKFQWFCDSLMKQTVDLPAGTEVLFIDLQLDYMDEGRREHLRDCVKGRFSFRHVPPKPCSWNGAYRKTKCDFFAASNTRNTAFIEANSSHVACVDDLSLLSPVWLEQVVHAVEHEYVMCGAFKKFEDMVVKDGELVSHGKEYGDSRWNYGTDASIKKCTGSLLYGCSFVVPLSFALRVNGFDEMCDGGGGEDFDFGIRLERAGCEVYYNRNALTCESHELHFQPPHKRWRKKNCGNGEDSDQWMLNRLLEQSDRFTTLANWTNIAEFRKIKEPRRDLPLDSLPETDWCDGQPLSEMGDIEEDAVTPPA